MGSQASVSSSASTIPLDLIHDQDNDFVDEIEEVDQIYLVPGRSGPKSIRSKSIRPQIKCRFGPIWN